MNLLDRYVGRIALGAFAAALLFFLFLSIVIDLLTNLGRYSERAEKEGFGGLDMALYLGVYYVKLLPVLVTTVTPFATVIACMFSVARLQHANEVVPMLFLGRSIHRILAPMLALGLVAALVMAGCWQWIVPHVGADLATEESFLRQGTAVQKLLVHVDHGEQSRYFFAREFDPENRKLKDVVLQVEGTLAADVSLAWAPTATWDPQQKDWRLECGRIERDQLEEPHQWLGRPDLTPEVLMRQGRDTIDPETLSYTDLVELAIARPNRSDVRLALHRHFTFPLANLLLLLLALPLAVHFERGGRIGRVLTAIGLCGGYMLFDLTCQSLGQRGLVHPVVAAWTPTIVFGSLGVVLYGSTRT